MKNKGFSWILLIIWLTLLIPGVLAVDAKLKESYSPGETIIAEISGPFIEPITMTNIDFQRNGHVSVPLQAGLEKVNEKYYLWAIAPLIDNNYTFIIKNVKTLLNGAPNTTEYRKDFVVKGKIIDYNVNPGAIYTLNDFDVVITSNKNDPLDVSLNINDTGSVTIQPGKNTIHFSIDSVQKSKLNFIQIGMYQIPVYVKVNGSFQISRGLEFSPGLIGISFIDRKEAKVGVVNMGTERLNSIGIEYNSTLLSVVPDMIANLSSGETQYVTITLKQDVKNIKTDIYARAGTL
ncbi:MAG: hypothetical protein WCK90_06255, partial [archaeon]